MALTLVQFWQNERATHEAAQLATQTDLTAAQQALVNGRAVLDADAAALNKLNADIAANRAKLPATSVPSDLAALGLVIRDQLVSRRAFQGKLLDDQDTIVSAQAALTAATSTMSRAAMRLGETSARLALATDAATQRDALKAQLVTAPLDTLQADANASISGMALRPKRKPEPCGEVIFMQPAYGWPAPSQGEQPRAAATRLIQPRSAGRCYTTTTATGVPTTRTGRSSTRVRSGSNVWPRIVARIAIRKAAPWIERDLLDFACAEIQVRRECFGACKPHVHRVRDVVGEVVNLFGTRHRRNRSTGWREFDS